LGGLETQGEDDNFTHQLHFYGIYFSKWINHLFILCFFFYFLGVNSYLFYVWIIIELMLCFSVNNNEFDESIGDV